MITYKICKLAKAMLIIGLELLPSNKLMLNDEFVLEAEIYGLKLMLGLVPFQLLSLLFGINSPNMLNHQIA